MSAKVWVHGHEWAKCQADHAGIGYMALANGFATCDDPEGSAAICESRTLVLDDPRRDRRAAPSKTIPSTISTRPTYETANEPEP